MSRRALAIAAPIALLVLSCKDNGTAPKTPNPTPGITALTPASAIAGASDSVLTIDGTDFVRGSVVRWGGTDRPTTYVSGERIQAQILAPDLATNRPVQVTVFNPSPGGGESNAATFMVGAPPNPVPTIGAVSPLYASVGSGDVTVTITGTGFLAAAPNVSRVSWDAMLLAVVVDSPTELHATVPAVLLTQGGTHRITVVNTAPGGGTSNGVTFEVRNVTPTVTAATPASALAGEPDLEVHVTGSNFVYGAVVQFNGAPQPTRFVSSTELVATVLAGELAKPGSFTIAASNPAPGGGTSPTIPFTVTTGPPTLVSLPSLGATAGGAGYTLTAQGRNFVRSSVIRWNGTELPTTYLSGTRLTAAVPSASIAAAGSAEITVSTPDAGGGASAPLTLTIRGRPVATLVSELTLDVVANDVVYDPRTGRLYASIASTSATYANSIIAIDPATGIIRDAVYVGIDPTALALSSDGQYLHVVLDGPGAVRRVDVASFLPGAQFALGANLTGEEIEAVPGSPGSVAVAKRTRSQYHYGVTVFDNGVPRMRTSGGGNAIAFGESGSVLYGYTNENSGFDFRTMAVTPAGVDITNVAYGVIGGFYSRIEYANGRIYSTGGDVADAERHLRLGNLGGRGPVVPDPALGRAFFVGDNGISAYDLNDFQALGTIALGAISLRHPALARSHMVRWGSDGLAFNDATRLFIVRTGLAAQ